MAASTLYIDDLNVEYPGKKALKDFSFEFSPFSSYSILGASGSGKTTLLKAIDHMLPKSASVSGSIRYGEHAIDEDSIKDLRGRTISYLLQDPVSYFNPVYTISKQLEHSLYIKDRKLSRDDRKRMAASALIKAGLKAEDGKLYPHQMSGGMLQRAALAIAFLEKADIILLDEPTSGLDSNREEFLLSKMVHLAKENGSILIFVTHSLSSALRFSDNILIMKDGSLIESGRSVDLEKRQMSEYGAMLFSAYALGGEDD